MSREGLITGQRKLGYLNDQGRTYSSSYIYCASIKRGGRILRERYDDDNLADAVQKDYFASTLAVHILCNDIVP
jgi:hypothetical protein